MKCPYCRSTDVIYYGKNSTGKQRMLCKNPECPHKTFQLEYDSNAGRPGVKEKIVEMAEKGYGIRNIGRVLKISTNTVEDVLKKNKKTMRHDSVS